MNSCYCINVALLAVLGYWHIYQSHSSFHHATLC